MTDNQEKKDEKKETTKDEKPEIETQTKEYVFPVTY